MLSCKQKLLSFAQHNPEMMGRKENFMSRKRKKARPMLFGSVILALVFIFANHASAQVPDIRGTYIGSGTTSITNCQSPSDNGNFDISVSVSISIQDGELFCGSANVQSFIDGFIIDVSLAGFSGTVTPEGQISGSFIYLTKINDVYDSAGEGTFSGQVTDNTMTVNYLAQDRVGDTCTSNGAFSAIRQ